MKNSPSFQYYPADLISDPDLLTWDMEMIGIYWWTISYLWLNGGLIDSKPEVIRSLTRRKRIDKAFLIWDKIKFKFILEDGKISHKRVTEEMQKQAEQRLMKEKAGKMGAEKRWQDHDSANSTPAILPMAENSSSSSTSIPTSPSDINPIREELGLNSSKSLGLDLRATATSDAASYQIAQLHWIDQVVAKFSKLTPGELETFRQAFKLLWEKSTPERFVDILKELQEWIGKSKTRDNPKAWFISILKKHYGVEF